MRRPLEAMVDRLAASVRTDPSGAKSLAHLLVVVPTAQSGRRLRLRLAERFGALVPPVVKTPSALLWNPDDPTLAGRTDEIRAFHAARGGTDETYELAAQLADIRAILAPQALTFADVAAALETDLPEEAARWRELAAVETKYYAELEKRGLVDRIAALKSRGPAAQDEGTEETIRLDDPAAWFAADEAPRTPVSLDRIVPCATAADEAERIAAHFAAVKPDEAYPALCVADPEMFPEIVAAMTAKGVKIHDPSETRLVSSSLGHLVAQLVALLRTQSYSVFSAFIRGGDARRWIMSELNLTDAEMTAALIDLDNRQAEFLPAKIDDIASKTEGKLRAVFEFVKTQLRKKRLQDILAAIFSGRTLDGSDPASREFAAAAEVVNRLIDECGDAPALFALRLEEATYSLEPDEGEVLLTDGWMELPFLEADELVIAGFREGCVPESTVGHPFLPDSLRRRLGLPDNAAKERRDRAVLQAAVGSRAADAVRISFHVLDAQGDVLKPSRLLFETDDDADLVRRVRTLYGAPSGTSETAASDLPAGWKLKLPVPPRHKTLEKISPTRLDGYLRCPFTFYLRDKSVLGDKRMNDRAEELESWEYGNLVHEALEAFGNSEVRDSEDVEVIRAFLEARVDGQLGARFGTAIPAIVAMQGESAKRRLANFAAIQAARHAEGWRITAVERKLEIAYGHTRLYGKCDRIDYHAATGRWCVIDYKTWDSLAKAVSYDEKKGEWKSLQLPIYCAMLDMDADEAFAAAKLENISSCYCVLGKTKDDVAFTEPVSGMRVAEAEEKIRELVPLIEAGIFWPPAPTKEWTWDYADWLAPSPEESVDEAWIADQLERRGDGR